MTQEDQIKDTSNTTEQVQDNNNDVVEENKAFSAVSIASGQKKLLLVVLILLAAGVIYYFIFEDSDSKTKNKPQVVDIKEKEKILKSSKAVPKSDSDTESNGTVKKSEPLEAPEVKAPTPPPPPPPPPKSAIPQKPVLPLPPSLRSNSDDDSSSSKTVFHSPFSDDSEEKKKQQMAIDAKKRAGIMVSGGGGSGSGGLLDGKGKKKEPPAKKSSSDFLGFGDGALDGEAIGNTDADTAKATEVNNLNRTIIQGKIINAVLETAINTDIPGMLRAIVTRDVYAEQGVDIMIPKGSRLVGNYASAIKGGQTRVAVMWKRLVRPDGIDIKIDSAGVDQLGRSGVAGDVYDHFWRKIGNAFLVSYVVPAAAAEAAKKATNTKTSDNKKTENSDGSTTTTTSGDPVAQAITDSTKQFSDITKGMIQDSFSTKPTITVDQGTIINILVQKDLVFPPLSYIQNRKINK